MTRIVGIEGMTARQVQVAVASGGRQVLDSIAPAQPVVAAPV
jgi:hypothetical protein